MIWITISEDAQQNGFNGVDEWRGRIVLLNSGSCASIMESAQYTFSYLFFFLHQLLNYNKRSGKAPNNENATAYWTNFKASVFKHLTIQSRFLQQINI